MTERLWEEFAARYQERCPEAKLRREEPLSRHTSFHIGGPAALLALPETEEELLCALELGRELRLPSTVLGNGSNLLVSDKGYRGLVVKLTPHFSRIERVGETGLFAQAGALLSKLASAAQAAGLGGLEFASGIPGSVGGGVLMNAGAYGGEMKDVITRVTAWDGEKKREYTGAECDFAYRHSRFSDSGELILSAEATLTPDDPEEIRARCEELSRRRKEKQPVNLPSAGSAFKRPQGGYAAAMIDKAGLKGVSVGGAQVSEKHAGFIVNTGGATCAHVCALLRLVRQRVYENTGTWLEPEIRTLGQPPEGFEGEKGWKF